MANSQLILVMALVILFSTAAYSRFNAILHLCAKIPISILFSKQVQFFIA